MSRALILSCLVLNLITLSLMVYVTMRLTPMPSASNNQALSVVSLEKLETGAVPATVIGAYGGRPWGNASRFVDPQAFWLWGTPTEHPRWLFFQTFTVSGNVDITATIHLIADQVGTLYMDGSPVLQSTEGGWSTTNYAQETVTLTPGDHIVAIYASNDGGTGGVIAAVVQKDGGTLIKTDASWKCKKVG